LFRAARFNSNWAYFSVDLTFLKGCTNVTGLLLKPHSISIKKLYLGYCHMITDEHALKPIGEFLPNVEALSLQGCNHITSNGVKENIAKCCNLKELNLIDSCNNQLDDECIAEIVKNNGAFLEEFDLRNSASITSAGFTEIAKCRSL
jgi:hypothetical protein